MANQWLRLWHDMPNDPKWRTIARVSGRTISEVMSVYVHLLVIASNATERGRTHSACSEDIASALDLDCENVNAIIDAMQGRVLDGDIVAGWSKRQVEREDGAAERAKAWREAKKAENIAKTNATERNRTHDERNRTPDKDTEKDTEYKEQISTDKSVLGDFPSEKSPEICDDGIEIEIKKTKRDQIPVAKVVELYHEILPELPKTEKLTAKRIGYIKQRWRDDLDDLECWRNFFKHVRRSDFLMGKSASTNGRPPFIANLEWLTNESNFTKIYEDKYHRKPEPQVRR